MADASRISDLVRAIKEYTYMDQASVQDVDIVRSLENTLIILNHKLKRGVTVHREYPDRPLLVSSFGSELNQVWTNLIDNASDAMDGKGDLDVRAFQDDDCVVVEIGDSGSGIPAEVQPRIFEPFFTTKPAGHGTGLGLSQVYGFCTRAGGTAQVESREGEGTTVRMYLKAASRAASAPASIASAALEHLSGVRVLLVEDNTEVAEATRAVLESLGCEVVRSPNAEDACARLQRRPRDFDLMLSDIVMPGSMNGIELATRARSDYPALPVVLMSGYSESMSDAERLGLEVLPKPTPPDVLAAVLDKIVSGRRTTTPA
jgi:CheY-like chemotaxis protein